VLCSAALDSSTRLIEEGLRANAAVRDLSDAVVADCHLPQFRQRFVRPMQEASCCVKSFL
jgi:hypothetical protein